MRVFDGAFVLLVSLWLIYDVFAVSDYMNG